MIKDYLSTLKPILADEEADYKNVVSRLSSRECSVNLMPSVTFDLYPIVRLQCDLTAECVGCKNKNTVYIASIGEHDFFFKSYLEEIVKEFYYNDSEDALGHLYGAELGEMLLLRDENIGDGQACAGANVVYMGFDLPNGSYADLFFVADNMLNTWKNLFERYSVKCDVLIDSHKGMGDWFHTTELCRYMQLTTSRACLPTYYFKGVYIGQEPPTGFEKVYSFEDENLCSLYKTSYNSDSSTRVIFLDIDGVLNSSAYDRARAEGDGNIDRTRLALLKRLVDMTGAKIVLSSTWREHWEKNPDDCDDMGRQIISVFASEGLEIYDKTPRKGILERSEEISLWLSENYDVQSFVIFDDSSFAWGDLADRLVLTNYRIGRGLEERHIDKALELLE